MGIDSIAMCADEEDLQNELKYDLTEPWYDSNLVSEKNIKDLFTERLDRLPDHKDFACLKNFPNLFNEENPKVMSGKRRKRMRIGSSTRLREYTMLQDAQSHEKSSLSKGADSDARTKNNQSYNLTSFNMDLLLDVEQKLN